MCWRHLPAPNDLWTPGVVNANSVHQGDYAAFVINGKKGTVAMDRLPTRLTSGAVIPGSQRGLQRSEMTVSTKLCWYFNASLISLSIQVFCVLINDLA